MGEIISGGLGNEVTWLLILVLIFSELINSSGLSDFIAKWFISRKFLNGHPWLFTFFFLLGCVVLSIATNIFLGILVMWGIFYGVCEAAGYKPHEKWPTMMMIGILLFLLMGAAIMPYRDIPLILLGSYAKMSGQPIAMFQYASFTIPMTLAALCIYLLLWKFIFRVDMKPLAGALDGTLIDRRELVLDKRQKLVLSYLVVFILLMFLPSFLPPTLALSGVLKTLGNGGILTVLMVFMCFTKVDGQPLFEFTKVAQKGVMWEVILITIVIMPMGGFITSEATGILPFILGILNPLFGQLPFVAFFFAVFAAAMLLTNVLTNVVVGFVLIPVVFGVAASTGVSAVPLVFMVILAVHIAILTPAACPYAAITLGNREWLKTSEMYKYGGITVLVMIVLLGIIGYLWTAIIL